ncbi:hypothetical protein ATO13_08671 [Stappia sp. 22II-S9-Z10]|nr:hypothetical protein ATO13_08671 [Stappia sp. 22II-S9-Z10]
MTAPAAMHPDQCWLAALRRHGRLRVYPHATARVEPLVTAGLARWGDPAKTLSGGTYGRWLELVGPRWIERACPCCGAISLIAPAPEEGE